MNYRIEIRPPNISAYRQGNAGVEYVHVLDSGKPGPNVMVQALTHGNEFSGAITMDYLFKENVRPIKGQLVLAGLLFAAAKVGATALVARLFMLTQPALMQIEWFAWVYDRFMPWKEALVDYVRESYAWRVGRFWKERARRMARAQWRRWRPTLIEMRDAARAAGRRLAAELRRLTQEIRARRTAQR